MSDNPLSGVGDKLGKLPPMAIVAVVVGALAIAYYVNKGNKSTTGTGGVVPNESGVGGMTPGYLPISPPTNNPATSGYQDNEAWASAAVGWLIGNGTPATDAGTAVRDYLTSNPLSTHEKALIDWVSKNPPDGIGPPPNIPAGGGVDGGDPAPIPIPHLPPVPTPTPTPTPTPGAGGGTRPIPGWNGRVFQVKAWPAPGSSLWTIAGIVYGNPSRWPDIYNANKDRISNPDHITAGMWLRIP